MLPSSPTERYLALILLLMFLLGMWMLWQEIVEWWKRRRELDGQPPLRAVRERFQPSSKSTNKDRPKKAA